MRRSPHDCGVSREKARARAATAIAICGVRAMVADPRGFLTHRREDAALRPVNVRLNDWRLVRETPSDDMVRRNASRCMDCGVAFCEHGCPLGNRVPMFGEMIADGLWRAAFDHLHATNNFPEFTGSLCPAPCEATCVLSINDDAVAVRQVELAIVERGFDRGWVVPHRPKRRSGRTVAIVGSGPAGLAAAQQLARAGHEVTVFERNARPGGLLRYGIPDFKMDKSLIDRRLEQMMAEGARFETNVEVGRNLDTRALSADFDAVVVACGATNARELAVPGAALDGVHQGLEYLVGVNDVQSGSKPKAAIDAAGRHVTLIGGGDTGTDCLATANRQGAASVRLLDHNASLPPDRDEAINPWPQLPKVYRRGFAHEEGVEEVWQAQVSQLVADVSGRVSRVCGEFVDTVHLDGVRHFKRITDDADLDIASDLVLLAMGFDGVEPSPLIAGVDLALTRAGTIGVDSDWMSTTPMVFACGDATRGASLVAWAIADGRSCAAAVDAALTGENHLPRPVKPTDRPL